MAIESRTGLRGSEVRHKRVCRLCGRAFYTYEYVPPVTPRPPPTERLRSNDPDRLHFAQHRGY